MFVFSIDFVFLKNLNERLDSFRILDFSQCVSRFAANHFRSIRQIRQKRGKGMAIAGVVLGGIGLLAAIGVLA